MDSLFFLILLYVVFSIIGSLFGKKNMSGKSSPTRKKVQNQDAQTTLNQYVAKLEQSFNQSQRSAQQQLPSDIQRQESRLSQEHIMEQAASFEESFISDDSELESALEASPSLSIPEFQLPEPKHSRSRPVKRSPKRSLLSIEPRRGYIQAIIMSEILGPPVSKRPSRFSRSQKPEIL